MEELRPSFKWATDSWLRSFDESLVAHNPICMKTHGHMSNDVICVHPTDKNPWSVGWCLNVFSFHRMSQEFNPVFCQPLVFPKRDTILKNSSSLVWGSIGGWMIFGPHDPPISRANRISSHEAGTLQSSQRPVFGDGPSTIFLDQSSESCSHAARPASGASVTRFLLINHKSWFLRRSTQESSNVDYPWEIKRWLAGKSPINEYQWSIMKLRKEHHLYKWRIFDCNVWRPEGTASYWSNAEMLRWWSDVGLKWLCLKRCAKRVHPCRSPNVLRQTKLCCQYTVFSKNGNTSPIRLVHVISMGKRW